MGQKNNAAFAGRRCLVYGGKANEEVPAAKLRDWLEGLDASQKSLRLYAAVKQRGQVLNYSIYQMTSFAMLHFKT